MTFRRNEIVDYYDSKRISCGLILDVEDRRLKILNDQGKEVKISFSRALVATKDPDFPLTQSRDAQIGRLKAISNQRDEIKDRIELRELWEVVGTETGEISLEDLSELFFGRKNIDYSASLLRAIFEDRLYFRIRPDGIEVLPPERVQQALTQREKEREKTNFIAVSADFVARLKGPENVRAEEAPNGLIQMLEEAAELGRDWVTSKHVKEILSQAGLSPGLDPFKILVKLGVWSQDENITLRAEKVPVQFSSEVEVEAFDAAKKLPPPRAEDLTALDTITIDATTTKDVDDALCIARHGDDWVVGIHITDAAHFVDYDSLLDKEIRQRATSVYLPETTIPMMPPVLSEQAASLIAGMIRPAISVIMTMNPDFALKHFRVVQSIIKVKERLCYEDVDKRIATPDSKEAALFAAASALRKARLQSGAIIFKDPELSVRVHEDGAIEVNVRDRETPSQILVSEMMIVANNLFARFMKEQEIPGIYRSQAPPLEKIDLGDDYDPVASYRSKKALSRGDLGVEPAPHSTLGLNAYTTGTSPLRRYPDLIIQRQIKSFLQKNGSALDREDLEKILTEISHKLERAVLLERERRRYFLLKYLERKRNEEFEAVVLQRFPRFYLVQIAGLGFNAALNASGGLSLSPRDRVLTKIEKVNPREEKLILSLVKVLH
jgi:exoribonuclease II